MKSRRFLASLGAFGLLFASSSAVSEPVFDEDVFFTFVQHVSKFERRYLGCDETGFPPEIKCSAARGQFDLSEWRKLSILAQKLFSNPTSPVLPPRPVE